MLGCSHNFPVLDQYGYFLSELVQPTNQHYQRKICRCDRLEGQTRVAASHLMMRYLKLCPLLFLDHLLEGDHKVRADG